MSYFKILEKAFSPLRNNGGGEDDLRIVTTEKQARQTLDNLTKYLKSKGMNYHRYIHSAMFIIEFWEKPVKTNRDRINNKIYYSVDGWHGTGKGNRNYGSNFCIFSLYKENRTPFDLLKSTDTEGDSFISPEVKASYIKNLDKINTAIRKDNIDSLFK